jgi:hypothetical protein
MNKWTWKKCCKEAIAILQKAGMRQTSNPQTVMEWYGKFRTKRRFTMPCKKNQLPPFLEHNQDITTSIKQYCKEHLGELSVEFVYEYLHHTILPNLVREINGSSREELGEQKYQEVLKQGQFFHFSYAVDNQPRCQRCPPKTMKMIFSRCFYLCLVNFLYSLLFFQKPSWKTSSAQLSCKEETVISDDVPF